MGEAPKRYRILIRGRVQAVGFRMSTQWEAAAKGLTGWVRNMPDGSVEVVAEGPPAALDELLRWCRKGPSLARVSDVQAEPGDATGEFSSFEIQ